MKNFKFKAILFNVLILFGFFALLLLSQPITLDSVVSSASCTKGQTVSKKTQTANDALRIGDEYGGNIPFTLFACETVTGTNEYKITDYTPTFTETEPKTSSDIYYYIMDDDSCPSFLLSSNTSDTSLYNTTIWFRFNDPNFKNVNDEVIPSTGFLNLTATVQGQVIAVERNIETNSTTKDSSILFAINLKDLTQPDFKCPMINDSTYLGGNGNSNDVSSRTGTYKFDIEYSYQDIYSVVSNKCVFSISFNILDYNTYVSGNSPFEFANTNTFKIENEGILQDTNYEVYNYNYANAPIVSFDATKFGFNFVYTPNYVKNQFLYKEFLYEYLPEEVSRSTFAYDNLPTGKVVVQLKSDPKLKYHINTYKHVFEGKTCLYWAKFDLRDFETTCIIKYNLNTTFQGTYSFDLDFLVKTTNTEFTPIDKTLFSSIPDKITDQKLVIFGYLLKYYDQDPLSLTYRQDVTLENDVTHTNFISYNSAAVTSENKVIIGQGGLVDIPEYIAITDQAPLRFHSYGNLTGGGYTSKFALFDYKTTTEKTILKDIFGYEPPVPTDYFINVSSAFEASNTQDYYQGASITGDGIRIMRLEYKISVPVEINNTIETRNISGLQYIVFEINNTVQNLYIQAIDRETNVSYDFDTYTNKKVRVNIEQKPNTFYAPVEVTYALAESYKREDLGQSKALYYKKNASNNDKFKYVIDSKTYSYFVTSQSEDYTFSNNGYYSVTIKSIISNVPKKYSFIIDTEDFTGIVLNDAVLREDAYGGYQYVKSSKTLTSSYLEDGYGSDFINYDLYVTDEAFTVSWAEKTSGASSRSYVYYMQITDDSVNKDSSLFKTTDNQYWLTNGLKAITLSSAIKSYQNSVAIKNDGTQTTYLNANNYFNEDGFYYFYVFDEAGNYFTIIVLIDSSRSSNLQGYWIDSDNKVIDIGEDINSTWHNSYNPVANPNNYVNETTTIYFGTHKAILLPNLSEDAKISFNDDSFTRAYDLNKELGPMIEDNNRLLIQFDFYDDVLLQLTNYIKTTSTAPIIGSSPVGNYLTIRNTSLDYKRTPTTVDLETEEVLEQATTGEISEIYKVKIYTANDPSSYGFNGEADYDFRITNANGQVSLKIISMNFDVVQGTFYAYNNDEDAEYYIRRNAATNLDVIKFEYNKISNETAEYYTLKTLKYDYYEFILDDSATENKSAYPFSKVATNKDVSMLESQILKNPTTYEINPINMGPNDLSLPGRYVVTREYYGGNYELKPGGDPKNPNDYEEVTSGGSYYKNSSGKFINLFALDTLVRKYIIYVDHNGIITSTYMVRQDQVEKVREVGDKISITLSNTYDDEWHFKEFFLTSTATLSLDTNKVPILINIPLSKYFVYYNSISNNQYAKQNFATLEISILYSKSIYSEWLEYKIDGYDPSTGLCTCSQLRDEEKNPTSSLLFSGAGFYQIIINDRTGYTDPTQNVSNADNLYPTTYTYSFEISHTSPETDFYQTTYSTKNDKFVTNKITNEDDSKEFATNIKKENEGEGKANNEVLVSWSDPLTPYKAKVNQINIQIIDEKLLSYTLKINLKNYNLYNIAYSADQTINLTNLLNSKFVVYLKVSFYENNQNASIYDNIAYYRYTYTLSVDITEEYIYRITLSYISETSTNQAYNDEKGNSFATSLYKLSIDRTKPYTNINSLLTLASEEFLSNYYNNSNIDEFKEENFDVSKLTEIPSIFTYSFGVNNNFKLTYDSTDTVPYFYVRNYEQYDGQYISISPDMVDTVYNSDKAYFSNYDSQSSFSINYPRFEEVNLNNNIVSIGSYTWYRINYINGQNLLSLISKATSNSSPSGFYEIIEKDKAGNYRTYTIYFSEYTQTKNYLLLEIDGYNEQGYSQVDNESDSNITASLMFEITELQSKLGWGKAVVKNETMDAVYGTIMFNPFDSYATLRNRLDDLNEFFECSYDSRFSITLSKYNSSYPAITRYINIIKNTSTAKLGAPEIEEVVNASTGAISYNLKFPAYTTKSVLYLESLTVNVLKNGIWQHIDTFTGKTSIPERLTGLSKGIYKAIYKDNYNKENSYYFILHVGEYYINNFDKEYTFEFSAYQYDEENGIYYSGGNINITYEANIYNIWVNGSLYSNDDSIEKLSDEFGIYNCKTFTLTPNQAYAGIDAKNSVGGTTTYRVIYRDITDNSIQKDFTFVIYNVLPEITLTNNYGGEVASTLQESDSQGIPSSVKINWGKITNAPYEILNDSSTYDATNAILYLKDDNGEYKNGIIISQNQTVTEEGYYKLQIKNKLLGNYREIYFLIKFGDNTLYTVKVDGKKINPSDLENLNLTSTSTNNLVKANEYSATASLLDVVYYSLSELRSAEKITDKDFYSLKNQLGYYYDNFNASTVGICSLTNIPHYYSIKTPEIIYNSNIDLTVVEFCFKNSILTKSFVYDENSENPFPNNVGNDYWTTVYLIYNLDGPIRIEFFAITKTPKTNSLLEANIYYTNESTNAQAPIVLATNPTSKTLTNTEIKNSDISLSWNKLSTSNVYWYNQGNVIFISDKYGVSKRYDILDYSQYTKDSKEYLTSTLTGSGCHNLVFSDLAGNIHEFAASSYSPQDFYNIYLIDSVIYYINYNDVDYNPIQYGVFNDSLKLIIDSQYNQYYSTVNIVITKNGKFFFGQKAETNDLLNEINLEFNESGRYVVQLSAVYAGNETSLNTKTYDFTIIDSNSARLAYEFVEIPNYEITKVIRNNENITNSFKNSKGKITSLFLSSSSSQSGNGFYTITLKYGKNNDDILTYSFSINDYTPTLSCNVNPGETTTGSVIVSYNPETIYEQLGVCYVKILTYNTDSKSFVEYVTQTIDAESILNSESNSIEVTRSNSYFVQVSTTSGNVVSSFRVNKVDPLNTFAIIVIIISSIAVIVLIIVIVKLRTKMKIK